MRTSRCSPAAAPISCSSKPGTNPPPPSTIWRSLPPAPGISSPPIRPSMSTVRMSPISAGRSTGSDLRCCSAMRSIAASTLFFRHLDGKALDAEIGEIGFRDFGQDLDQHLVFEVGALGERDDVEFRRQRRAQIVLADRVGGAVLHRALEHFAEHRGAIAPAQNLHRDLARAKTRQPDRATELVEPADDLVLKLAGRDDDVELALQPFGAGFGHLHGARPLSLRQTHRRTANPTVINIASLQNSSAPWCGRGDLNPHDLHRWNLNPVRLPIPPRPQRHLPKRPTAPAGPPF